MAEKLIKSEFNMELASTNESTFVKDQADIRHLTLGEIRRNVDPECFKKDTFTSIRYLVQDWLLVLFLYILIPHIEDRLGYFGLFLWYWVIGIQFNAIFLIGHDCGHGTFSNYTWINDLCGHLSHAPLLTPYWPFQKSHRLHHIHTNHIEKDKGHPWPVKEKFEKVHVGWKFYLKFPLTGWFRYLPMYTIVGIPDGSHYWPGSKLFSNRTERIQCAFSSSLCIFFGVIAYILSDYSFLTLYKYYIIPLHFQGLFFTSITYLQHRNEKTEVYEQGKWKFVQAQTQTIDRKLGFGLDTIMHHIGDGHVAHHFFFTEIPHYKLRAATEGIKKALKRFEGTPYAYKTESSYDFIYKFFLYNWKLDYVVPKSPGIFQWRVNAERSQ